MFVTGVQTCALPIYQAGALPPAALEDLVQKIKEFDIDAAIAAQGNGEPS